MLELYLKISDLAYSRKPKEIYSIAYTQPIMRKRLFSGLEMNVKLVNPRYQSPR